MEKRRKRAEWLGGSGKKKLGKGLVKLGEKQRGAVSGDHDSTRLNELSSYERERYSKGDRTKRVRVPMI